VNTFQARTFFERLAVKHDLKIAGMASAGTSNDWVSRAFRDNAEVRLTWRAASETLKLEISQGPESGEIAGWSLLFSEVCESGIVPSKQEGESYESAVLYGLELMGSGHGTNGALYLPDDRS
jgi:hypothetical protein